MRQPMLLCVGASSRRRRKPSGGKLSGYHGPQAVKGQGWTAAREVETTEASGPGDRPNPEPSGLCVPFPAPTFGPPASPIRLLPQEPADPIVMKADAEVAV